MRRRVSFHSLVLLSAVWAWLGFVVVCGAIAPRVVPQLPVPTNSGCCHNEKSVPPQDACASPACGLTCAALLTAVVTEARVALVPAITSQRFSEIDERADMIRHRPPVPPPKRFA